MNDNFDLFGGRTEVFRLHRFEALKDYDFNSEYVDVMTSNQFPIPPYVKFGNKSNETIESCIANPKVFAIDCIVDETHRIEIPAFPEHVKINGSIHTLWRAKVKTCLLFRKEMEYCINHNIDVKVLNFYECSEWREIFAYLKEMYKERLEIQKLNPKDFFAYAIKILMLATYGKLAQKTKTEDYITLSLNSDNYIDEAKKLKVKKYLMVAESNGYAVYCKEKDSTKNLRRNKAIACMITAYARLNLLIKLETVNFANLFNCDTDSIFTTELMETSDRLGALKLENDCESGICLNVKAYSIKTFDERIVKAKGMSSLKNLSDAVNDVDFIRVRPSSLKECWRRGLKFESVLSVSKKFNSVYVKRRILSDLSTLAWTDEKEEDYEKINFNNYQKAIRELFEYESQFNPELNTIIKKKYKKEKLVKSEMFSHKLANRVQPYEVQMRNLMKRASESLDFENIIRFITENGIDERLTTLENWDNIYNQSVLMRV